MRLNSRVTKLEQALGPGADGRAWVQAFLKAASDPARTKPADPGDIIWDILERAVLADTHPTVETVVWALEELRHSVGEARA